MAEENISDESSSLTQWDPHRYTRKIDAHEARYSRGFLRSRPERWFPGFAAYWLPLAHSVGVDLKLLEAKPSLFLPKGLPRSFSASVDDEPLAIFLDEQSYSTFIETLCPGAIKGAGDLVAEYLARRFITSLALSWSGPESSVVHYEGEGSATSMSAAGCIKVSIEISSQHASFWIAVGPTLLERLDGLWRRQIRSGGKSNEQQTILEIEVAQLSVPPALLSDYLKTGTVIDLELPISENVTLRLAGKPWLPARICQVNNHLGIEVVSGPVSSLNFPEGTTRLSIQLASQRLDQNQVSEINQVGAILDTETELSDKINLVINSEKVGDARLSCFEGRFAVRVG